MRAAISVDRLEAEWLVWRRMLVGLVGTTRRADAVLGGMRLQAWEGTCFASARFLGGQAFLSNKAWLRTLSLLRERGLAVVKRRVRPAGVVSVGGKPLAGTQGTYETDFRRLWRWLLEHLATWMRERGRAWGRGGRPLLRADLVGRWLGELGEWVRKGARWWWDPGAD